MTEFEYAISESEAMTLDFITMFWQDLDEEQQLIYKALAAMGED